MGSSHFVRTVRSLSRAGYVFPTSWPEGLRCCAQFPVAVPCTRPCHPVGGGGRGFLSCGPPCGGPRDSSRDRPVPRLPLLGVAKCRLAVSARPLPGGWAASAVGCSHDLASLPPYARISNREGGGDPPTLTPAYLVLQSVIRILRFPQTRAGRVACASGRRQRPGHTQSRLQTAASQGHQTILRLLLKGIKAFPAQGGGSGFQWDS